MRVGVLIWKFFITVIDVELFVLDQGGGEGR